MHPLVLIADQKISGTIMCYFVLLCQSSGAPIEKQAPTTPPVAPGDRVRVQLELEVFKLLQDGHGGWNDQMKEVGVTGRLDEGKERGNKKRRCGKREDQLMIMKIRGAGGGGRVYHSLSLLTLTLQALSTVGTVQTILDSGNIRVRYPSNRVWTLNSDAIMKVSLNLNMVH